MLILYIHQHIQTSLHSYLCMCESIFVSNIWPSEDHNALLNNNNKRRQKRKKTFSYLTLLNAYRNKNRIYIFTYICMYLSIYYTHRLFYILLYESVCVLHKSTFLFQLKESYKFCSLYFVFHFITIQKTTQPTTTTTTTMMMATITTIILY